MSIHFKGKNGPMLIAEIGGNHEADAVYARELTKLAIQSDVDAYCDTLAEDTTFIVDLNYKLDNKVKDISLNQDIKLFINDKVDFELGWESKYLKMNYAEQFARQQTYQNN